MKKIAIYLLIFFIICSCDINIGTYETIEVPDIQKDDQQYRGKLFIPNNKQYYNEKTMEEVPDIQKDDQQYRGSLFIPNNNNSQNTIDHYIEPITLYNEKTMEEVPDIQKD